MGCKRESEKEILTEAKSVAKVVDELEDHEEVGVCLAGQLEARNPGDIGQEPEQKKE